MYDLNPRRYKLKKVTRRHKGWGGGHTLYVPNIKSIGRIVSKVEWRGPIDPSLMPSCNFFSADAYLSLKIRIRYLQP